VASLVVEGEEIGLMGEIHPLVREAFGLGLDLETPVVAAELDLDKLLVIAPSRVQVKPIPTQPPVYRDIAVVVPDDTTSADVEKVIWTSGGELLESVRLFDVYRGDSIGAGNKSLAYALVFQSTDETLNDKRVNTLQKKIVGELEKAGAKLRS
jgi:phenylalanyl-tRNA synthetase beta chain